MIRWTAAALAAAVIATTAAPAAAGEVPVVRGPAVLLGVPVIVNGPGPLFMSLPGPIVIAESPPGLSSQRIVVPEPVIPLGAPVGCYQVNALLVCPPR
ncbi:hypothetical protein [Amorphus orientalis]|uniref:Uncharacterized protein n=1 Tax=Amorphus orientalis TaxID=649198 RepID=A0AAE4AQZ8_9HYPH|nr:hypothetical protein [Amorphus orientalis]MDQ0314636.1 hypothetical protein [Amorphus orientalis]